MTSSEGGVRHRALWIGPAAQRALGSGAPLRVHSLFTSTLNLEVGEGRFLSLCGPHGAILPHAVALEGPGPFAAWGLTEGEPVRCEDGHLRLRGREGEVVVTLLGAERPALRPLPPILRLGPAYAACRTLLEARLAAQSPEAAWPGPWRQGGATSALGEHLHRATRALGSAAGAWRAEPRGGTTVREWEAEPRGGTTIREGEAERQAGTAAREGETERQGGTAALRGAVAGLVGLGAGLTPSGDDFLCGFLAAAWTREPAAPGLPGALGRAMADQLPRTGRLSAFLMELALEGFWPEPLLDLAEALAGERKHHAAGALADLGRLGHSSGTDLACGFLYGLGSLRRPRY